MTLRPLTLGCLLTCGLVLLVPTAGFAQTAAASSAQRDSHRLRGELERVNAEIATLKSSGRGVRSDYLLRDKLAEAEALARRLTEAEARERTTRTSPAEISGSALIPPVGTPHDSVVELEAKADLLSDQARRFRAEAEALTRTAEQIRARQALRRRAGAWDRDPLAGFESSKRNLALSARTGSGAAESSGAGSRASTPTNQNSVGSGSKAASSDTSSPTFTSAGPTTGGPGTIALAPETAPPTDRAGPAATASPTASHPLTAPTLGVSDAASKTLQQRPLLDPASLASVRSTLSQSGSLSDPDAIEAASVALRKHAQALEERARRLRAGVAQE